MADWTETIVNAGGIVGFDIVIEGYGSNSLAYKDQIVSQLSSAAGHSANKKDNQAKFDLGQTQQRVIIDIPSVDWTHPEFNSHPRTHYAPPETTGGAAEIHINLDEMANTRITGDVNGRPSNDNEQQSEIAGVYTHENSHDTDRMLNRPRFLDEAESEKAAIDKENMVRSDLGLTQRGPNNVDENLTHPDLILDPSSATWLRAMELDKVRNQNPGVGTSNGPVEGDLADWVEASDFDELLPVPETLEELLELLGDAISRSSPLVFDMNDNGAIDLSAYAASNTSFFDLDEDGFAERTGWVDATDGILVYDENWDGRIENSSEWFGTSTTDGFSILSEHDINQDGQISEEDVIWGRLQIWQDADQDGVSDVGELTYLDDLNIISISLNATEVSSTNDGHSVTHTSTFVVDDGISSPDTRIVHDIWFNYNQMSTRYAADHVLDSRTFSLLGQRGYGILPDFHIAMSLDNEDTGNLLDLVTEFSEITLVNMFDATSGVLDDVRAIMYRWAGVDGLAGNERGAYIDSRELGFLEAISGEAYLQRGNYSDPGHEAGEDLKAAFQLALNHVYARLVAQSAGAALFTGDFYYNISTDSFDGITGLDFGTLDDLETEATGLANTGLREIFWSNVLRVIEFSVGVDNLSGGDQTALNAAIEASDSALDMGDLIDELSYIRNWGIDEDGTSGADTKNGTSADDIISGLGGNDTLNGLAGQDNLIGGGDNDILNGGTGGDLLQGGTGDDDYTYALGDGDDVISETSGTDELVFGAGIDAGDITLSRAGVGDLVIDVDTGSQTARFIVENHFTSGGELEQIRFSGGSTMALTTQNWSLTGTAGNDNLYGIQYGGGSADTIYGGDGNDIIIGHNGNDTLYGEDGDDWIQGHGSGGGSSTTDTMYGGDGNDRIDGSSAVDIIYGGAGDDYAIGSTGNDEYHFTSGHDRYEDSSGTDEIFLPTGFTSAGTVYYKIDNDLKIVLDSNNSITLTGFYAGPQIETLDFFSDPDVDLSKVSTITQGTSGNNTLNGTSGSDTLYGFGGNDTLNGDAGNDFLYGGTGNDTITGGTNDDYMDGGAGDDSLSGSTGDDTYVYVSGNDTFLDQSGSSSGDLILMEAGWTLEDMSFERHVGSLGDGVIRINASNSITLSGQFSQGINLIETIKFLDTSTLTLSSQVWTTHGTSGNNTMNGLTVNGSLNEIFYGYAGTDTINGDYGNDTIYGGDDGDTLTGADGNDLLYGENGNDTLNADAGADTLRGGAGNDTVHGGTGNDLFIYDSGLDTMTEYDNTDTLLITGGRTINDMTIANHSSWDAKITITASVDEIILSNMRSYYWYQIEYVTFDDGFIATLPNYASWLNGTSGNDTVAGNGSDNVLIGFAGNDTITGGSGNDAAHGGAGNDTLDGDDGTDLLYGGDGDDLLYGEGGLDTLHGGAGEDTFKFHTASAFSNVDVIRDFSVADGDIIDLTDILSLAYDPLTDDIADFISFSESTGSTFVSVDRDGTAGTYSMAQIIKLENLTGLSAPDVLETNGNLLAA